MKKVSILMLIALSFSLFSAEKVVLTTLDWEPYIGQSLNSNGFVAEIAREALKREGYDLELQFYPWARTKDKAVKGEVDGYFPEYYAKDIESHSYFSEPFMSGPVGFFKLKGSKISFDGNLQTLKPYKIGVVRDYVNEEKFDAADFLTKEAVRDDLTNIKKLLAKRIDLFVADKFVGMYLLNKELPDKKDMLEFITPPLIDHNLYICFSKKGKQPQKLLKAFNSGLEKIKADGTYDKILKKHGF